MSEPTNISNLSIDKFTIKGIEINSTNILTLEFYEGLTFPGITGGFSLRDWQGMRELGNILPGDDLDIQFSIETKETLTLKFKIYSDSGYKIVDNATYQNTVYHFCSPWIIEGFCRQVSMPFKDKYIHEIVESLLLEVGAEIGIIEETEQKLNNFVTPLWTVPHSISHLSSFAKNKKMIGGYILWPNLRDDTVNFTTLDYLFKGKFGKYDNNLILRPNNIRFEGRIYNILVESSFDLIKFLNEGFGWSEYHGFNFDNKSEFSTTEKFNEYKHQHLASKFPLQTSYLDDEKYKKMVHTPLFPSTDSPITDKKQFSDFVDGRLFDRYAKLFTDTFKVNVIAEGESSRRCGYLANLNFPSSDQTTDQGNKAMEGLYLIRNIRHIIQDNKLTQAITLISDGYKEYTGDIVSW